MMKSFTVPTSNLPLYIKEHIDVEKHPYSIVKIKNLHKTKVEITIIPSNRGFYE